MLYLTWQINTLRQRVEDENLDRVQPNGSYRMVLQMSSRSTSCWSMLSHRVHLVVPWICKAQTAYILRSQELGGTLRRC